jgi:hypothetical protein
MTDFQKRLLAAAIRAPSGDNCQPWRFHFTGEHAVVIAPHFERAKSFFDYGHRATALSIGASIENMRVQAASEGFTATVAYADSEETERWASMTFSCDQPVPASPERVAALFQRTVNRRPFLPLPLASSVHSRLLHEPVDGTTVEIITDRRRIGQWAQVIELADRIRYSHPVIHEELFSKLLLNGRMVQERRMGLGIERLGVGPLGAQLLRWLRPWKRVQRLSRWGLVRVLARQSGLLARSTGALVLITIAEITRRDWIRAGEQVQRLWIRAQEEALQTHPMPVALYLDQRYQGEGLDKFLPAHHMLLEQLRSRLAGLIPSGTGAMIFRIGRGWRMSGLSVRLPLDRFMDG